MEVSPCEFEVEMDLRRCEKESEEEGIEGEMMKVEQWATIARARR